MPLTFLEFQEVVCLFPNFFFHSINITGARHFQVTGLLLMIAVI